MAVTLTAPGLAAAFGIKVAKADDPADPGLVEADRLLTLAGALVEAYARDPGHRCPETVMDEAIIRTAGHLQNRAGFGRADGRFKAGGVQFNVAPAARSAVRQSGAAALLAPWVLRTA